MLTAPFRNSSIGVKLSGLIVLNSGLALLMAGAGILGYELFQSRDTAARELSSLAEIISASSTAALSFQDERAATETLSALRGDRRLVQAAIYSKDNGLFASYRNAREPSAALPAHPRLPGVYLEHGSLLLFHPILLNGERIGTILFRSDMSEVYDRLLQHIGILGAVLMASLVLTLLLGYRLQRIISAPIAALAAVARLVSVEKNYSVRATKDAEDEIGVLIDSFNEMLSQIEQSDVARKAAVASLRESEERYALAARGANDGLWDWKLASNQVYFSPRWNRMLGYQDCEVWSTPEHWFSRIHPADRERVQSEIKAHCAGETPEFASEYKIRHQNGTYIWMLTRGIAVRDAEGTAIRMAGSQTDITEGKIADSLTELPTRLYFMDKLESSIDAAQRSAGRLFAVLFVDLDRFKLVNDSLGHAAGDRLLVEIAGRLRRAVHDADATGDSIVARLGGDEFAILLDELRNPIAATMAAERILKELDAPFSFNGRQIFTSASVGIALSSSGSTAEDLLRNADTAMYHAKSRGKARFELFDEGMRERAIARAQIESDMRHGIQAGEFIVYYQPKVSLRTGRTAGFEALVRWNHPERGIVSPVEFIPIAEETELIVPLGRSVLTQACRQMAEWHKEFAAAPPLTVSVNLSFRQLTDPGLVDDVERILWESGLNPESLKLELTESSLMENAEEAIATLQRLKAMGIGLEIDDFGTGYSSLNYLHRLPFDTVKIDRSFVKEIGSGGESLEIVRTILKLAGSLGMEVVAEGVETREQVATLTEMGCGCAQGYYFSKPVDVLRAARLIRESMKTEPLLELASA
jgi:diguanylate cyclase (GGDEF)-like protein/PAS domain S-box-containing protein